jgi:hypothetical protein
VLEGRSIGLTSATHSGRDGDVKQDVEADVAVGYAGDALKS